MSSSESRAMDPMNLGTIKGRPIKMIWSQDDSSLKKSDVGNVFIKNLDKSIDVKTLYETFSSFGNILSCEIACDEHGSKGYGFVYFDTEEAARQSIEKVNGMLLNGKKVFVSRPVPRKERIKLMDEKHRKYNNVYIKNFGEEVDDEKLREMFEQYGKIISAKVMYDDSGKSCGFGFVSFEEPEAAEKAVTALNGQEMGGKQLYCGRAQKKAERQVELEEKFEKIKMERINRYKGLNLYIKNLDDCIDDDRLQKEFSQFGTITSAKVMEEGGKSKGFGFVCFSSPEEAAKAVAQMDGHVIVANTLYVTLAQLKEERAAQLKKDQLSNQHKQRLATMRQQNVQYNPINAGGAGYFVPAMPQAQRGFFTPGNIPLTQQACTPWTTGVRPNQVPGFRAISNQINCIPLPTMQAQMCLTTPNIGQSVAVAAALSGVAVAGMTHPQGAAAIAQPGERQAAIAPGGQQMLEQPGCPIPQPQLSLVIPGQGQLTASMLAAAPPQEQKQMLGERLFPLIQRMYPDLAGKITAKLLEIDNSELLHLLESHESLKLKVEEAMAVLQVHQAKEAAGTKKEWNSGLGLMHPQAAEAKGQLGGKQVAYSAFAGQILGQPDFSIPPPGETAVISDQDPLSASMLTTDPPKEQKQMLNERLFPLIQRMFPDLAGKIIDTTLPETDNSKLLHMLKSLESLESLKLKVEEATPLLQVHQAKEAAAIKKEKGAATDEQ